MGCNGLWKLRMRGWRWAWMCILASKDKDEWKKCGRIRTRKVHWVAGGGGGGGGCHALKEQHKAEGINFNMKSLWTHLNTFRAEECDDEEELNTWSFPVVASAFIWWSRGELKCGTEMLMIQLTVENYLYIWQTDLKTRALSPTLIVLVKTRFRISKNSWKIEMAFLTFNC